MPGSPRSKTSFKTSRVSVSVQFSPPSRSFWFGSALLVFLVSSWIAFRQEPCPRAYGHQQTNALYTHWWLASLEFNAPLRLPEVQADLNDVFALKGTGHVWAVGSGGLILHSPDAGRHWERQYLVGPKDPAGDRPIDFQTPASPPPANPPKAAATAAALRPEDVPFWRRLVPGNPLEGALLLGLLSEEKARPTQQQQNPAQQTLDPSQQNKYDPKTQAAPPDQVLTPNSGVSTPPQSAPRKSSKRPSPSRSPAQTSLLNSTRNQNVVKQLNGLSNSNPNQSSSPNTKPATQLTLRELANSDLYSVHFLDARNGWIAGNNGLLFSTPDGGVHWYRKNAEIGRGGTYLIHFKNQQEGLRVNLTETGQTLDQGGHWKALPQDNTKFTIFTSILLKTRQGPTWRILKPNNSLSCIIEAELSKEIDCLGEDSLKERFRGQFALGKTSLTKLSSQFHEARSICFSDFNYGWIAGAKGLLQTTDDGGQTWRHTTRKLLPPSPLATVFKNHHLFPAPWYYLSLLAVGLLLAPGLKLPKPEEVSESAADLLISDNPISTQAADAFDFSAVALGLSRFLRNEKTVPPLTIAVTGEWGSGKSSLMNLLRADLERYKFRPVWFNAWHHQKEENLLASLLETVRTRAIPPWWRPEGAIFRYKLLKIRWLRFWPIVMLFLIGFAFSLGYIHTHSVQLESVRKITESIPASLEDLLKWITGESEKISEGRKADGHVPWVAFLLSSTGLLVSLWKGLKGFGVSPASLLAKDSGSAKVKDLENLTGFRYRFAAEFKDITEALNPRTLLILIDDLDRCRPEMVLEVLESVNFLVSSGDCFIVMGMARERVVRCVGLSFKDVASELLTAAPDPAQGTPEEIARRQRIEFAQQYLEKLINIEVPVPSPTDEQSRRLMLAASESPVPAEPESRGRVLARQAWGLTRKTLPFAAVAGLLVLGYWFGATRSVQPPVVSPVPVQQAAPSSVQSSAETSKAASNPTSSPTKSLPTGPARMEPGVEARLPLYPVVLLLIVLLGLGVWRLSIPPGVVLHDSPDFEQALKTWHPLVFSFRSTPRSIKRFLNRVRYLAMLQRKQVPEPTLWQTILAWLLRRPLQKGEQAAAGNGHPAPIPEDVLVALAAIEYCRPEWLQNNGFFIEPQTFLDPKLLSDETRETIARLAVYREPYFRVSRGVHMS